AQGLGIGAGSWLALRVAALMAAVAAWRITGIALVLIVGLAAAVVGLPWYLSYRADNRRLAMEKAFVRTVREIRDLMRDSDSTFDQALQYVARARRDKLTYILNPLAGDAQVDIALEEVARRARSPLVTALCVRFIAARTRDQRALMETLTTMIIPRAEAVLEAEDINIAMLGQQRTVINIVLVLLAILLYAVSAAFSTFYTSLVGQIWLVVDGIGFAICVAWINATVKRRRLIKWDVSRFRKAFGGGAHHRG
ncbi:MAG: hypothetical protein ACYDGR_17770, partial [Candidatus Dormibacteria bacterium]